MFALFGALIFSPLIAAQTYCNCGPTTTVDSNLGATSLSGDTVSINEQSNCPGSIGPKDLTSLSADLSGKNYTLVTTVTSCGNSFPTLCGAWIDFNNNLIFEEDEKLGAYTTGKNAISFNFTVPANAIGGKTRLRVQVQETQATTLNPCATFPYGATKDFTVEINKGPPPPPPPPEDSYCVSGPLTTEDANLGFVTLIGEYKNIRDSTDCPGRTGNQNMLNLTADVVRGKSYQLSFNVTTCQDTWPTSAAAWIDFDHDNLFTSADLVVNYTKTKGVITQTFTVPKGDYAGPTVMRVQVQETDSSGKIDPCAIFSYGGTKDFGVTLIAA